jgi:hypothetical protein
MHRFTLPAIFIKPDYSHTFNRPTLVGRIVGRAVVDHEYSIYKGMFGGDSRDTRDSRAFVPGRDDANCPGIIFGHLFIFELMQWLKNNAV